MKVRKDNKKLLEKELFDMIEEYLYRYDELLKEIEELKRMEREFDSLHPTEKAYAVACGIEHKIEKRSVEELKFVLASCKGIPVIESIYQVPCRYHVVNAEFCSALNVHMSKCPLAVKEGEEEIECPMLNAGFPCESYAEERFSQWWMYNFPEVHNEIANYISYGEMPNPNLLKIAMDARVKFNFGRAAEYLKSLKNDFKTPKKESKRKPMPPRLRFRILERDNFTCQYCGSKASDGVVLHVDHIKPVAKGGTDDESNLITACQDCNLGKSDKELDGQVE